MDGLHLIELSARSQEIADGIEDFCRRDGDVWREGFRMSIETTAMAINRLERSAAARDALDADTTLDPEGRVALAELLRKEIQSWTKVVASGLRDMGYTRPAHKQIEEMFAEIDERNGIYGEVADLVAASLLYKTSSRRDRHADSSP